MFNIKRKLSAVLILMLTCSLSLGLTGCSILKKKEVINTNLVATNNSSKLSDGQFYVWHDDKQTNIESDIGVDVSKFKNYDYKIFQPVYKEVDLRSDSVVGKSSRVFWMQARNDDSIPTLYKGDELIYYSSTSLPTSYTLEHFYDHGYSIGVYGLSEIVKGSGTYSLNSANNFVGIKNGSTAAKYNQLINDTTKVISIPYVGDTAITQDNVSQAGTIKGLLKGNHYKVQVYAGTKRYVFDTVADTRIFSSMDAEMPIRSYEFVGNGVIKLKLPEYLKTGYYVINGAGIFRYVNGDSYDDSTNFNDPIIIKTDTGKVTYNPIQEEEKNFNTKLKLTNDDNINSSSSSEVIKNVKIADNETIRLIVNFSGQLSADKNGVTIEYYLASNGATSASSTSTEEGSISNPYRITATKDELQKGKVAKELSSLKSGTWVFTITGLDNYKTHSESFTTISTTTNSSSNNNNSNSNNNTKNSNQK